VAPDATPEALAKGERRQMDCMDCHNRPSHQYAATPERAIDQAIANGEIERKLPYIRREAVRAIKQSYPTQEIGFAGIAATLATFYTKTDQPAPDRAALDRAIAAVQRVYGRNIFPTMKVTWGTYANNLGHLDFPGCFRCHDDNHKAKDGTTNSQDCELCHKIES